MDPVSKTNESAEDYYVLDDNDIDPALSIKEEYEVPSSMSLPPSSHFDEERTGAKEESVRSATETPNIFNITQEIARINYSDPVDDAFIVDKENIFPDDVRRLDIDFSFRVKTRQTNTKYTKTLLDPYMDAVEEVVLRAIADDAILASKVTYTKEYKPYVQSEQWDRKYHICWLIVSYFARCFILSNLVPPFSF